MSSLKQTDSTRQTDPGVKLRRLTESERRFRSAFDYAPIGMALVAPDGRWLEANNALCKMLGYSQDELLQTTVQALTHPEDSETSAKLLRELLLGERDSYSLEKRYFHKQGRVVWVSLGVSAVYGDDGTVDYTVAQFQDVTQTRQVEKALEESRTRYRTILDTLHEGVVMLEGDGQIVEANASAEKVLGLSRDELLGRTSLDPRWRAIYEDGRPFPGEEHYAMQTLRTGEPCVNGLMGVHKPSGELAWLLVNTSPLFLTQPERPDAVVASFIDVTELKESAALLARRAEQLERSNRDLQDFAYVASHDLQEPLRMVSSYVQLLERRYKDKLDEDAVEFIGYAVDGAKRMQTLINDLLAYSRVSTKGDAFVPVDLEKVLAKALSNLRLLVEEQGAVITHDPLPTLPGDATQLLQLLQNLLGNALKFCDETPHIHISAENKGDVWQLDVRDNGIGIDEASLERVFTIFQRLHTRDVYEGTGIGLAVCRRIAERHGGQVWATSQPGEGSTFHVTLKGD